MLDMINGENLPGYKKNLLQFHITEEKYGSRILMGCMDMKNWCYAS